MSTYLMAILVHAIFIDDRRQVTRGDSCLRRNRMFAQKNENSASESSFNCVKQSTHPLDVTLIFPFVDGHIAIRIAFGIVAIRQSLI